MLFDIGGPHPPVEPEDPRQREAEDEFLATHGRCEGCGEWVALDQLHDGNGHTRAEHAPACDGYTCAPGCPVPVACGPVYHPSFERPTETEVSDG